MAVKYKRGEPLLRCKTGAGPKAERFIAQYYIYIYIYMREHFFGLLSALDIEGAEVMDSRPRFTINNAFCSRAIASNPSGV